MNDDTTYCNPDLWRYPMVLEATVSCEHTREEFNLSPGKVAVYATSDDGETIVGWWARAPHYGSSRNYDSPNRAIHSLLTAENGARNVIIHAIKEV